MKTALIISVSTFPAIFFAACTTLLALRERKQWVWFALLTVFAGFGSLTILNMVQLWRYSAS